VLKAKETYVHGKKDVYENAKDTCAARSAATAVSLAVCAAAAALAAASSSACV